MALLIARLCELGVFPDADFAGAFVAGVEAWIFDPTQSLTLALPEVVLASKIRIVRRDVAKLQIYADSQHPDNAMNDAERVWGHDFRIALGTVPPPWGVTLQWLDEQSGIVEIAETIDGKKESFQMRVRLDEPPARFAFSLHPFFHHDSALSEAHEFTERDVEVLRDPRKWISGGTHPG